MKSPVTRKLGTLAISVGLALPLHADLINYWSLDETEGDTAADSAGTQDAVFQNPDVSLEWTEGRIGGAAKLVDSGGEDYFIVEAMGGLSGAEAMTISAWVEVDEQSSSGYNGIFMTRAINEQSWGLARQGSALDSRINGPGLNSDVPLSVDGGWYHILMIWDGKEGINRNYVNGILAGERTNNILIGPIEGETGPWFIGYDNCCGGNRDFDGTIDEVAVWNEVLDEGKIALLAGGARPDELDTVDLDSDGIPNDVEDMFAFLDPNNPADGAMDEDEDGLSNAREIITETKLDVADSDGDGLLDGEEVNTYKSDPNVEDTDGDTLTDFAEVRTHMTDPRFADTDGDQITDSQELLDETDPNDPLSPTPPAPGLVGLWRLDETSGIVAKDSAGGNDGVWQMEDQDGLEWLDQGIIGGAADLTDAGDDNYFEILSIPQLLGAQGVTLSAWISADNNPGYNGIFMSRQFNLFDDDRKETKNNSWGLAYEGDGRLDARVDRPGNDSPDGLIAPEEGVWHHVVLTWNSEDGTHIQYVDGVETARSEGARMEPITGPSGPWFIGYDNCCGGGRDFDGKIDDVAVWSLALSSSDIADLYQAGLAGVGATPPAAFNITDISRPNADNVSITWTSQPGQFFSVRSSSNLEEGAWTTVQTEIPAAAEGSTTSATVAITGSTAFYRIERAAPPAYLDEDFEGEVVGWTTQTNGSPSATMWELGTPTLVGPAAANSGTNLYGTDLDAAYEDFTLGEGNKGITVRSPVIDLAGDTFVTLEFAYFLDLAGDEQGGGRVNVLDEQGELLTSIEPLLTVSSIESEEVVSREWTKIGPVRLPQSATDAGKIMVEFEFLSAESVEANGGGLYIDDVVVK